MNKKVLKPIVLVTVFIVALFVFSMTTNKVNKDLTATMEDATLPVIQFTYNDATINELHGYTQQMDMLSMRDGVLPIGDKRVLHLELMTYGQEIERLSYEIRSLDGTRLLVEGDNIPLSNTKDKLGCDISLPSLFEDNEEYIMMFTLQMDGQSIYYYTRIMKGDGCFVDETLAFALSFHEYTFRDDADKFIPTYMDPATGDPTTLHYVDLSCTLRQITWAQFAGVKLTEPVVSFKEINSSYNVLTLNYVITNINELNETEFYNVEEYYRLRQTPTRMYVLNFERTMSQIFKSENDFVLGDSAIQLGIRDEDVEYLSNDSGECIAFVQEGELWCYDRINHSISQVYSFRGMEGIDARENWDEHNIKIVSVDEAGSIVFLVYGYMNRGIHEGQVGIGVYRYDGIAHNIEEEVFIRSDQPYEVLKAELGELMYVNEQKILYLMMNHNVYQIDLTTYQVTLMIDGKDGRGYAISDSHRYVAWVDSSKIYESTSIKFLDLKTGISHDIVSGISTYVRPLDFIGEDFIYGVALISDVKEDVLGTQVFPMFAVEILNTSEDKLDVIKSYRPGFGYVEDIHVAEGNIYVDLMQEEDGRYVECGSDTIMNKDADNLSVVDIVTITTEIKQRQVTITMKPVEHTKQVKVITPKYVLAEDDRLMNLDINQSDEIYYVYQKGNVILATADVSEAILCANKNYGVVVDNKLNYIFKRARNTSQTSIKNLEINDADVEASTMVKCISAMLMKENAGLSVKELIEAGQTPYKILKNTLKDAIVLELKDCSMDELLYYVDQGTPVYAQTGEEDAILVTGYTSSKIYYYDADAKKNRTVDYEEIEALFQEGGHNFIVYIK